MKQKFIMCIKLDRKNYNSHIVLSCAQAIFNSHISDFHTGCSGKETGNENWNLFVLLKISLSCIFLIRNTIFRRILKSKGTRQVNPDNNLWTHCINTIIKDCMNPCMLLQSKLEKQCIKSCNYCVGSIDAMY